MARISNETRLVINLAIQNAWKKVENYSAEQHSKGDTIETLSMRQGAVDGFRMFRETLEEIVEELQSK